MSGYEDAQAPDPYAPDPHVPDPDAQAPYGPPGRAQQPYPQYAQYPQHPYPQQPYAQQPYPQQPYGQPAWGQPGHAPSHSWPGGGGPYLGPSSVAVPGLYDPPRRRGNGPVIVATVVVWALVMVGIVVGVDALAGTERPQASGNGADPSALVRVADPNALPEPVSTAQRIPSPGFEEEPDRLETAVAPADASDEYAFLETYGGGQPVGWSPCRPIHVVVNLAGAPAGFLDELLDALGEITRATGLVFVYDGPTTERPDLSRSSYLPERYGDRWAPVLVAWADDDELSDFKGDVVGLALSETRGDHRADVVVRISGEVYLDTELRTYPDDPTGQEAWVSVLHHELGHLIGLDHVDESDQLMYPEDSGRLRSYQEGDRAGLYELGQGACAPGL